MTKVARTPSPFPVASPETLAELEFGRVLELVAGYAVGELGALAVRARRPGTDRARLTEQLQTVAELASALRERTPFTVHPVPDLTPILEKLDVEGGVLDAAQLVALRDAVGAARAVRQGLVTLEHDAPRVAALAVDVPPAALADAINRALGDDGAVKDDASPELERARRRVRETRARLIGLLQRRLRQLGSDGLAGDTEVTVRDGRYVIPVRREARGRVQGLVHGESASGATIFFEPPEAVDPGNELNAAQADEARAVQAVLRDLTDSARAHRETIEAGWRMAIGVDDLYARARYMIDCGSSLPTLNEAPGRLVIRGGIHPLIPAQGKSPGLRPGSPGRTRAVPFDLDLSSAHTLVVSGPNAGGKTVLLKSVGVIAALAQAGVVPPVGEGTELPVFASLFVDIGDHQSIAESLSTFSAHLTTLKHVLESTDDRSLVLLDELGGGTDPAEGAALAGAVLLSLHERGGVTLATTHLSGLKELAAERDDVVNASLEFDAETLAPTYRFTQGKPGRSYGLAIARRLGLPDDVVAAAEARVPEELRTLEATLAELERREQALAAAESEVAQRAAQLDAMERELNRRSDDVSTREADVRREELELEQQGRKQARRFLLEARKRVEEALGVARAAVSEATAKEARRLVEEGVSEEAEALKKLEEMAKRKGWRVTPPRGKREGGPLPASPFPPGGGLEVSASSQIDIRGLRAEEAESAVVAAVDSAFAADLPWLRVIHGKGTGALRDVVQRLLSGDKRVADFHLAPPHQGGAGVTLVEFHR